MNTEINQNGAGVQLDGAPLVWQLDTSSSTYERSRLLQNRAAVVEKLLQHPLVTEAFAILEAQLPSDLFYHNVNHTRSVFEAAVTLALHDELAERDVELLAIAAAWHDVGYIAQRSRNEPIGAQMAKEAMERHGGYSAIEIRDVYTAIIDTEVVFDPNSATVIQKATGRLSAWLLDADLANFGSAEFLPVSLSLFREFTGTRVSSAEDLREQPALEFIAGTLRMLNKHLFQTPAANILLAPQKELNIRLLGNVLAQSIGGTERSRKDAWEAMV
jgi:predicted metal-dependent HD superfamily phosphohydrolase